MGINDSSPEVVAWLVDGRIEQGLTFDKMAATIMADANCGTVRPLVYGDVVEVDPNAKVTRVEVIDGQGRTYTNWKVSSVSFSYQDDGRTLKLFISETTT